MTEEERPENQGAEEQAENNTQAKAFELRLSDDRMCLFINCVITPETQEALITDVCAELVTMGIRNNEDMNAAARRLSELTPQGPEITGVLLLQSTPPTPPKHGEIVWAQEFFKKGFEIDPVTGAADYRRKLAKLNVAAGQLLATVIPPVPGESGRDLLGKNIPAEKARRAILRTGSNVEHHEEDDTYYATKDGRIRFAGSVLAVDDVFVISGSVDLKTGHINHPGALVVEQNIESEAVVNTEGDIDVHGYIENAKIKTDGNISIQGGISGSELTVAGSIHAKFLQNCRIEAGGDIFVDREIDQSEIKTRGAVYVMKGRIVGGEVTALAGIETDQIGSDAYLRTTLIAGEDYTLRERIAQKESELESRKETLARIISRVEPLRDRGKTLPPRMREAMTQLLDEAEKLKRSLKVIEDEIEEIREDSKARAKCEVLARRMLLPDALIHCAPLAILVKDHIEGPVKAAIRDGKVRLIKMRSHS